MPLIATLLGIPTGERYPPLDLTPQRQKQLTLEALLDRLEGLAAHQPILMIHEDVHWIGPTTQELLGPTIERIPQLPVLMIITFRPEAENAARAGSLPQNLTLCSMSCLSSSRGM